MSPETNLLRRQADHEMKERMDRLEVEQKVIKELLLSVQGSVADILEIMDAGKAFFHVVGWIVSMVSKIAKLLAPIVAFVLSVWAFWQHWTQRTPH